jgi:carboxymethylenebutenolidase
VYQVIETRPVAPGGTPALVCRPDAPGTFPCFILLHERYGLVQHTEDLARKASAAGYVVVAPDLFYTHPDQAGLHAGTITAKPADSEVLGLLEDAFALFAGVPAADTSRLGMMGVCQTGRYPFVWAKHHPLGACIALYGAAQKRDWEVTDHQPWGMSGLIDAIDTSVLGIFGEKDHIISFDDVVRLRGAL